MNLSAMSGGHPSARLAARFSAGSYVVLTLEQVVPIDTLGVKPFAVGGVACAAGGGTGSASTPSPVLSSFHLFKGQ